MMFSVALIGTSVVWQCKKRRYGLIRKQKQATAAIGFLGKQKKGTCRPVPDSDLGSLDSFPSVRLCC